jgi:hypothetical protein
VLSIFAFSGRFLKIEQATFISPLGDWAKSGLLHSNFRCTKLFTEERLLFIFNGKIIRRLIQLIHNPEHAMHITSMGYS